MPSTAPDPTTYVDDFAHALKERPPHISSLVVRVARQLLGMMEEATPARLAPALAAGSTEALWHEVSGWLLTRGVATAEEQAQLRADQQVRQALARSGGFWTAEDAQRECRVSRTTLATWRTQRRVLALALPDGSYGYPAAQFERPRSDLGAARPYPAVQAVLVAAQRMSPEALLVFLANAHPQLDPALPPHTAAVLARTRHLDAQAASERAYGHAGDGQAGEVTGFAAIQAGRGDTVVALIRRMLTPEVPGDDPDDAAARTRAWERSRARGGGRTRSA